MKPAMGAGFGVLICAAKEIRTPFWWLVIFNQLIMNIKMAIFIHSYGK
jgi:hypothetical protein